MTRAAMTRAAMTGRNLRSGRRARRSLAVVCAVAAGATGLSGCSLGAQGAPEALDPRSAPRGLLGTSPRTSTSRPSLGLNSVTIYLEGSNQRLVPAKASVPGPASMGAALNALAQGPTAAESARGLVSPASSVGPLRAGPVRRDIAIVGLPASFENLGGQDQTLAAAQVVFTLTAFPGVKGVVFLVGGQAAQVPDEDGKLVAGPLTRSDYPGFSG